MVLPPCSCMKTFIQFIYKLEYNKAFKKFNVILERSKTSGIQGELLIFV